MPMRVLNPTMCLVTLHIPVKVAHVFPCVVVEDLPFSQAVNKPQLSPVPDSGFIAFAASTPSQQPEACHLADVDLECYEVSHEWKYQIADLVLS